MMEPVASLDPFQVFGAWYEEARDSGEPLLDSLVLATASRNAEPSARWVLLKEFSASGFVFYTNYDSRKAHDLNENPRAALVFYWPKVDRQIRIEGRVEKVSRRDSEAYFSTRARGSQLGAHASRQSSKLANREELVEKHRSLEIQYDGKPIPCPEHWGGYRVIPRQMEFMIVRENRLHDRWLYSLGLEGSSNRFTRLSP
jgi:pyridoxamine 5'-phosphate oxidase